MGMSECNCTEIVEVDFNDYGAFKTGQISGSVDRALPAGTRVRLHDADPTAPNDWHGVVVESRESNYAPVKFWADVGSIERH
jgi:hypothetical protein